MNRVEIIAEIGNTHEGSLGLAKAFVRAAADCGVDSVKFQTHIFDAESLLHAPNPPYFKDESRKEYFDRTGFTAGQWQKLKEFCAECGVSFLSSPFSLEAVELLESIGTETYKVASGEVSNLPLLERLAATGKRVCLSSGMSSWDEIDKAVETMRGKCDLTLMQCTSVYPCPPEKAGLGIMREMSRRYGLPVGFSDHTLGPAVPLAAVALGAVAVEKHFTLSKKMYGPDAPFSATPEELADLVSMIREVELAVAQCPDKDELADDLTSMKTTFEKSVVAARGIKAGTVLTPDDLAFKKPGDGIPAARYRELTGRTARTDIQPDTMLDWEMVD